MISNDEDEEAPISDQLRHAVLWKYPQRWDTLPRQRVAFVTHRAAEAVFDEWQKMGQPRAFGVGTNALRINSVMRAIPSASIWADAEMHVPREAADRATKAALAANAELLVAVGGGSAVGFAKWVANELDLPIIAVPSTLAGSEATCFFGVTENEVKRVQTSPKVLPRSVVYDSGLLAALPHATLIDSAFNALAHAVDSLWTHRTDEALREAALSAVSEMRVAPPNDRRALLAGDTQRAAYRSALVFAATGSGVHHKICHVLGGTYALPHAAVHAAVLPYVAILSAARDTATARLLANALASDSAERGFAGLHRTWGTPPALRDIGLAESLINEVVAHVETALSPLTNDRFTTTELTRLIAAAWAGERLDVFARTVP